MGRILLNFLLAKTSKLPRLYLIAWLCAAECQLRRIIDLVFEQTGSLGAKVVERLNGCFFGGHFVEQFKLLSIYFYTHQVLVLVLLDIGCRISRVHQQMVNMDEHGPLAELICTYQMIRNL